MSALGSGMSEAQLDAMLEQCKAENAVLEARLAKIAGGGGAAASSSSSSSTSASASADPAKKKAQLKATLERHALA